MLIDSGRFGPSARTLGILVLCLAVAGAGTVAGCKGRGTRKPVAGGPRPPSVEELDRSSPRQPSTRPPVNRPAPGGPRATTAPGASVQISALRERALGVLTLAADDTDPSLRANAIEALALAPGRAEPIIARALRDANEGVRSVAAMVVGRAGFTAQSGSLRPLLSDRSPYVRASAVFGLAKTVGADPSPLAGMLLSDPSPRVRSHAVFILGEIGDDSALPMIREAVRQTIPRASETETKLFQLQAAEAMVKLGDASRLEAILASLFAANQDDLQISALAAQILGGLGYKSVTNDLKNLAGDIDASGRVMPPEIRMAAAGALAKLNQTEVGFIADQYRSDESPLIRAQAAFVYGENRNPADLAKLEPMLGDRSGLVRVSAAGAILKFDPGR